MLKLQKAKKWGKVIVLYFLKQMENYETENYLKLLLDREKDILEIIKSEFEKPAKIMLNYSKKKDKDYKDNKNIAMDNVGNIKKIQEKRNITVIEIFKLAYFCLIEKSKRFYEIL